MATIRAYRPEDQSDLYRICLLTGDSGEDATAAYADPKLLGHVFAGPYGALQPDLAFVVEDGEGVGGYVLGALDTAAFEERLEKEWWPPLRARYTDPDGKPRDEMTADERMVWAIHHPSRTPAELLERYPSHLHIDILPRLQGTGNGAGLIRTLLTALGENGSRGVHLGVGARNVRAIGFYRHMGFEELAGEKWGLLFGMSL
ncbi:MAG TPA: GNAT family N-acetyltransferase [Candidatus Dormibacteraeota bacterium]|nr:GNAT family N-acetyltransferase [Candidatus Dormibacteraeota bacterium]